MRISDWSSDVCSSDLIRGNDHACSHLERNGRSESLNDLSAGKIRGGRAGPGRRRQRRGGRRRQAFEKHARVRGRACENRQAKDQSRQTGRPEESRVGNNGVSTCRDRGRPTHEKKNKKSK